MRRKVELFKSIADNNKGMNVRFDIRFSQHQSNHVLSGQSTLRDKTRSYTQAPPSSSWREPLHSSRNRYQNDSAWNMRRGLALPTPKRMTQHMKRTCLGLRMINPNSKQTCLDPIVTHSNPKTIAAVMKNTATRAVAGAQAQVTETEELAAAVTVAVAASKSELGTAAKAAGPAGEVVSARADAGTRAEAGAGAKLTCLDPSLAHSNSRMRTAFRQKGWFVLSWRERRS